jgi:hypothetical protein
VLTSVTVIDQTKLINSLKVHSVLRIKDVTFSPIIPQSNSPTHFLLMTRGKEVKKRDPTKQIYQTQCVQNKMLNKHSKKKIKINSLYTR